MVRLGKVLIFFGIMLLLLTLLLYFNIVSKDYKAIKNNEKIIDNFSKIIRNKDNEKEFIDIYGDSYVGILAIPQIDLNLPILNNCDNGNLDKGICLYGFNDRYIIAGHNRTSQFRKITQLKNGDKAIIYNTRSIKNEYSLVKIEKINSSDYSLLMDADYALTLFTCDFSGNMRYVLRFE